MPRGDVSGGVRGLWTQGGIRHRGKTIPLDMSMTVTLLRTVSMPRKTPSMDVRRPSFPSIFGCLLVAFFPLCVVQAQAPVAPPAAPVAPSTMIRLYNDADKAFADKQYPVAIEKITEFLKLAGPNPKKEYPVELLYFNIGLAYLLDNKPPEAETAFTDYLKRYPKGENASRAYLGVGRACIDQGTPEKKEHAIEALKLAALDPRFRSEAGLWLGQTYVDLGRLDEALAVFRTLMGSDIRSPSQTTAAVEVISLLADTGKLEDLIAYLDRLINQAGVRDALAWYANQVIVRGDNLVGQKKYEAALAIYRSVPPRSEIVEIQTAALESQKKDIVLLENRVKAEETLGLEKRSNASEILGSLKPAVEEAEKALAAINEKAELDPALLMRRGRCLFYLHREEEALVCFRTIRNKYGSSADAQSAAFAEIFIFSQLKDIAQLQALCDAYLRKYPDAENAEQVATLAGEVLVQSGKWAEIGKFYNNLESKFPKSDNIDKFVFYQGVAIFQDGNFKDSTPIFERVLKNYPNSDRFEMTMYYLAMSKFLSDDYKGTIGAIKEYLTKFPEGHFVGDLRYRLAFIDSNDPEDQTNKIIRDLTTFLARHPKDSAAGSMYCLLGDTYKKKTSDKADELAKFKRLAIDAYKNAVWLPDNIDDVIQYGLDEATKLMQEEKDWAGISEIHTRFLKEKPTHPLALLSAGWIAKMKVREGKPEEAAQIFADALKASIGNPANEAVESLIDELVKSMIPKGKKQNMDLDAIDLKLKTLLETAIGAQMNPTANARIYYARARLAEALGRREKAELWLKGIATINEKDPTVLSPALLAVSGDILLKMGNLESAEAMYRRLSDRYRDGSYADAGPVGLGYVALAKKKPEEALKIFQTAIDTPTGTSRIKEAMLGKLESMVELEQFDDAEKLAEEIIGDKSFRGEPIAKAYILRAKAYRKKAAKETNVDARIELFKRAYALYNTVILKFKANPVICAEAAWQGYECALEMGNREEAGKMLNFLRTDPKLKDTPRQKEAEKTPNP